MEYFKKGQICYIDEFGDADISGFVEDIRAEALRHTDVWEATDLIEALKDFDDNDRVRCILHPMGSWSVHGGYIPFEEVR